jgi:hypothetical protein
VPWSEDWEIGVDGMIANDTEVFTPISDIAPSNIDGSVSFLSSNDVHYRGEVNDTWFSAYQFSGILSDSGIREDAGLYVRDDPTRVARCLQRYQFCKTISPKDSECTTLTGIRPARAERPDLWRDGPFDWSIKANTAKFMDFSAWLDNESLLAQRNYLGPTRPSLPDHQWELKLEHWFQDSLASRQE